MLRKKYLKRISYLLCGFAFFSLFSLESFARDDNPTGNTMAEFPTPSEIESGNSIMTNNKGTISRAISSGEILYNFGTIDSLEGATVQENCNGATINKALGGTVTVNKGTIGEVNNTAVIKLNALDGVIDKNLKTIEQNMGTVKENYSSIVENRGTIEKVGTGGTVSKHIEGTIGENSGTVTVVPDPNGIITVAVIEKNSGTVCIEADSNNKSTVKIKNNASNLVIKTGADCIVENNSGTVTIEDGGKCILTGTNSGTMPITGVVYPEGEYYKLILDNISSNDIQMISNYKIDATDIYVLKGDYFSFTFDESKYSVMWSDGSSVHSTSVDSIRSFEDETHKYVDDTAKTVTLHIHTFGSYVPSEIVEDWHEILCPSCGEVALVEACSGGTATCKEKARCAKCGREYGSLSLEHSFGEWIITKEAQIGVEGKKYRDCDLCGYRENATIPAIPEPEEPHGGENPPPDDNNNNTGNNNDNKIDNNNSISENEQSTKNGNSISPDKKDVSPNEPIKEKAENDKNSSLQEEVKQASKTGTDDKPQSDAQIGDSSSEELISEKENEGNGRSDEPPVDDTPSFEEPNSKGKSVKWPIAAAGACAAVAAPSIVVVRIKRRSKMK